MRIKSVSMRAGLLAATAALGVGSLLAPAATAATPPSIISKGDTGHGVWCVQHAVNLYYERQYNKKSGPLAEDAVFGTSTADWVAWYQGQYGLHADSVVGKSTGFWLILDDSYYGNYCKA
ncbi:peptidoglycan-binding protein [Streptomyces sp. GbtcB7]|uniref:peptidoglycan-binding domain-containing protein n=1 Tax=Streptomyces sp. GbtcB7 TaxID=2824752 RepID=UPI001C301DAD|nr:peptidoglycan-binding domain-containing protein [Streptomyces sp. GbtcB7]